MCELFGFTGSVSRDLTEELRVFFSHGPQNPNGWGIAQYDEDLFRLEVEAKPSHESPHLQGLLQRPVKSRLLLAHIRRASVGDVRPENCHPFYGQDASGRGWMLMHNGTVFSGLSERDYLGRVSGTTDSERLFCCLLDRQNTAIAAKGAPLTAEERCRVAEGLIAEISCRNKMNLILTDGELLYVHMNMRDTLHVLHSPEGALFSTRPLSDDGAWECVPLTQLLAYRDGKLIWAGTKHDNEYRAGVESACGKLDFVI